MRKLNCLTAFLFLLTTFIAASIKADACSCIGPRNERFFHPCSTYWSSDAVFIGTAETVSIENERTKVNFSVEKAFRGEIGNTIEVFTGTSMAICGYPFKQGEKYFVYVRRNDDGKFQEGLCGPTVLLQHATQDLEYVKALEAGESGARVFGGVSQITQGSPAESIKYLPLPNIKISLEREKKTFKTTTTDTDGKYEFRGVPGGVYGVRADLPKNLREVHHPAASQERFVSIHREQPNRCAGSSFAATRLATVEGTVSGRDGTESSQQYVQLLPLGENQNPASNYFLRVWTNRKTGGYFFNLVPPGSYLVAINPKNCPNIASSSNPAFGRSFYPGVDNAAEAEIITVAEGEAKKLGEFSVSPLKERLFSGVVLSADKKPIAGASVNLTSDNASECGHSFQSQIQSDEFGRFQFKGYETYKYQIRAYVNSGKTSPPWRQSPIIDLPEHGSVKNLELIISSLTKSR